MEISELELEMKRFKAELKKLAVDFQSKTGFDINSLHYDGVKSPRLSITIGKAAMKVQYESI